MLKKTFPYLGICLLALTTSQCFTKCKLGPGQDTTNLILQWQEEGKPLDITDLDFTQDQATQGKVCYVPSEDATYFINLKGHAWRFTRDTEGNLEAQKITKLPQSFKLGEIFAFAAGTKEQQSLFVGKITDKAPGSQLKLWKQESANWQTILSITINNQGSNFLSFGIRDWQGKVGSCTWEYNQEIRGCMLIPIEINSSFTTAVLVFDPNTNKFKSLTPIIPRQSGEYPIEVVSPAPNKLILGYGDPGQAHAFSLLSIADDKLSIIPKELSNDEHYNVAGSFSLQLDGELLIKEPIFYALQGDTYQFIRLDANNKLVSAGDPTITLDKKTLILPFANELYCITNKDIEGKNQTLYYQAKLEFNKP